MKVWQILISRPQVIERGPRELRAMAGPGWMALMSRLGAELHRLGTPQGQLWVYRKGPTQPPTALPSSDLSVNVLCEI